MTERITLTVIILTYNEAVHILRAIRSVQEVADHIIVVDSGSTDNTVDIALAEGAEVLIHPFINQAEQFNWALSKLPDDTEWVLRLDADEIISPSLSLEIQNRLSKLSKKIQGVFISRYVCFLGRRIKWGGVFPIRILRLFRYGYGHCENRWMDEHIFVNGETVEFSGEIIDNNLNSLTYWTEKHNNYACREVIDILNKEYQFMQFQKAANITMSKNIGTKRWIKENIYLRLPISFRAFGYFIYRYIFRLGFLDGMEGTAFHLLQCFWYRYLIDLKLLEIKKYLKKNDAKVDKAIKDVLGIDLISQSKNDASQ